MFGHHKDRHLDPSYSGTKGMLVDASPKKLITSKILQQENLDKQIKQEEKKHAEIKTKSVDVTAIGDQHELNYCCHQQLIDEFTPKNIQILRKNINDLPVLVDPLKPHENSTYENIPESKGNNLFYLIIFNANLSNNVKKELLSVLIFQKGYDKWAIQLFSNPFYKKLLENGLCFQVLEDIYIKKFVNKSILPGEIENHFLMHCFQNSILNPIDFYSMQKDFNKKIQLLSNWINYQTNAVDIITVYDTIRHKGFGLNDVHLKCFLKIAKQKVLDIEIKRPSTNRNDNEQVRGFLDINRDRRTSCLACLFTRRSVGIHRMIQQGNIDKATAAWNQEEKGLHNFYSQYGLR